MAFEKKKSKGWSRAKGYCFCLMLIVEGIILTCKIKSSDIMRFVQKYVLLCNIWVLKKDTFFSVKIYNFKKEGEKKNLRKYIDGMHW